MRKLKLSAAILLLLPLLSAAPSQDSGQVVERRAISLYRHGLFDQARALLQGLDRQDAVSEGYAVLCALRSGSRSAETLVEDYFARYGETVLSPQIHLYHAESMFEAGDYDAASQEFLLVDTDRISKREASKMAFEQAYSDYCSDRREAALYRFEKIIGSSDPIFSVPSHYFVGTMYYEEEDFPVAERHFRACEGDSRFSMNAGYYILECRFMQKDYEYVAQNADIQFSSVPEARRQHLSRIISESFLILGDTDRAAEFYDNAARDFSEMDRADHFWAGSLQYAMKNYGDAISHFEAMGPDCDSLSQIASYQSGFSFINIKNQVGALDAFKKASEGQWRADIREDALFNYAKLAFDLNHDPAPFHQYIETYSDTKKGNLIYSYMALAALMSRDYAAAVEAYDQIDELDDDMRMNYMKANFLRGAQLASKGAWSDAIPCLKAAGFYSSRTDGFNKLSRYWLAECQYHTENYDEALDLLTELYNTSSLDRIPEGESLPYGMGYCCFKKSDFKTAARWFDVYLREGRGTHARDAALRKGDCYFLLKDYESAAAAYLVSIDEYPSDSSFYPRYQLGLSYGLAKKLDRKTMVLLPAKTADPSIPYRDDALFELGRNYVALKQNPNAIEAFVTLKDSSTDPDFKARALIELGMLSRNSKNYESALGYYKEVVSDFSQTPYRDDALVAIESIYQSKGEPEQYIAYIESIGNPVNRTEEEKEQVFYGSAEQIYLSGNVDKAIVALDKYLDLYPEGARRSNAWFYLADCYKSKGNNEKACEYYSLVSSSSDAEESFRELSTLNLARISFDMERFPEAYNAYSSLLGLAKIDANSMAAKTGMMRSAFKGRMFIPAIEAADALKEDARCDAALRREADMVRAKSYMSISDREKALSLLEQLSGDPSTAEGAEASYMIIQDLYDRGEFDRIEARVYRFSDGAGSQSYWLAKAFIVLGDSFAERDQMEQARVTFESVQGGYEPYGPEDDVPSAVAMRLKKLKELQK